MIARLAAGENIDPAEYSSGVTVRIQATGPDGWLSESVLVASAARAAAAVEDDLDALRCAV